MSCWSTLIWATGYGDSERSCDAQVAGFHQTCAVCTRACAEGEGRADDRDAEVTATDTNAPSPGKLLANSIHSRVRDLQPGLPRPQHRRIEQS